MGAEDNNGEDIRELLNTVVERLDELTLKQANMAEIIVAWNNTKGFVRTVQMVSKIVRWFTVTAAAVAAIWYLINHGSWPK